jgi:hypothetical protein
MGLLDSILSALGLRKPSPDADASPPGDPDDERDPELEAQDDAGSFDFDGDIARYFTAEFRIETAWSNHERRAKLFAEYEIRDAKHWRQIQATFERWLETPAAKAKYRTAGDLMQARMTTTQTMTLDDLGLGSRDEPTPALAPELLEPIEGVSLERWAKVEAALQGGAKLDDIIGELELDPDTWTRAAAAWRERMEQDASATIAGIYSQHVGSAAAGRVSAQHRA